MKITVFIERENKIKNLEANNINDLLNKLNINPETVILSRNNQLITEKTKLKDNDNIRILPVISGG